MTIHAQWQPFADDPYTCFGGRPTPGFRLDHRAERNRTLRWPRCWEAVTATRSIATDRCRRLRHGLQVTVDDRGGAQIDAAAIAHLLLSTPMSSRTHTVDFHNWVTVANGTRDLHCRGGTMSASTGPGVGIDVDVDVDGDALGVPLFHVAASSERVRVR